VVLRQASVLLVVATTLFTLDSRGAADEQKAPVVSIQKGSAGLDVSIDDKPFFTYQHDTEQPELRRPVIHPLYGPNGGRHQPARGDSRQAHRPLLAYWPVDRAPELHARQQLADGRRSQGNTSEVQQPASS
jgi:hypothetical protein